MNPTAALAATIAADYFGIDLESVCSRTQSHTAMLARCAAYVALRDVFGWSSLEIAHEFARGYSVIVEGWHHGDDAANIEVVARLSAARQDSLGCITSDAAARAAAEQDDQRHDGEIQHLVDVPGGDGPALSGVHGKVLPRNRARPGPRIARIDDRRGEARGASNDGSDGRDGEGSENDYGSLGLQAHCNSSRSRLIRILREHGVRI